jgi:cytochrome o ubiquinol oxidase operon protein cyoD
MSDRTTSVEERGSPRSSLLAYLLSLVLTAVPFVLVMTGAAGPWAVVVIVAVTAFALAQIVVHLVLFLHLGRGKRETFKLAIFLYTLIILAILVGASVWIMFHLDAYHMVP